MEEGVNKINKKIRNHKKRAAVYGWETEKYLLNILLMIQLLHGW
jgi:hypothetical protein